MGESIEPEGLLWVSTGIADDPQPMSAAQRTADLGPINNGRPRRWVVHDFKPRHTQALSTNQLTEKNRENNLVTAAIRNAIGTLQAADFSSLTEEFGPDTANSTFSCSADGTLSFPAADSNAAKLTGEIVFFNDEVNIPPSFADLSGGFDINGNGFVDNGPVTGYKILPARLVLNVANPGPPRRVTVDFVLSPSKSW